MAMERTWNVYKRRGRYREWHRDETQKQVGDGQVDHKHVASRSHGRLASHDVDNERIAQRAKYDKHAISSDEAKECAVVDTSIGTKTFYDGQVQLDVSSI